MDPNCRPLRGQGCGGYPSSANGFVLTAPLDIREPEPEARGGHPAKGDPGSPSLLLSLLGPLPQHPADPAALPAGPGRVQVRLGFCQDSLKRTTP